MASLSLDAPGDSTPAPATVSGVELFSSGTYDGQSFDEGFIDKVVANHALISVGTKPLHRPPVVLGHEEDQEWLTRTDLPAAGWVGDKVWKNAEGLMLGDFVDVPGPVAAAINSGAFKKVSCEFYDDFVDNTGKHYGPALRRVALLGAEIPKVKGLADLPAAKFSDTLPAHRASRVLKFAEAKMASSGKGGSPLQAAVSKMLKDAGLSQPTIDMMAGNEELMAAVLADLTGAAPADPNLDPDLDPNLKMSEAAVKKFSKEVAEVKEAQLAELKKITDQIAGITAKVKERETEEKQRAVYVFCESLRNEHRIAAAELDETAPSVLSLPQRLLAMDNTTVKKFSEADKEVSRTPRQMEMERLRNLPQRQFSEKLAAGKQKDDLADLAKRTQEYVKRTSSRPAAKS